MLFKRDGFVQLVHFKSRELGIHPKLLLLAIKTLAQNPGAQEKNVFKMFFEELLKEAREAADKQIHSIYKKTKEEAEEVLKPIKKEAEAFANSAIYGACQLNQLVNGELNLLQIHYNVWNTVIDQQIKIKRMYGKKYISADAIQIIKYLCPKEIEDCKTSGHFKHI